MNTSGNWATSPAAHARFDRMTSVHGPVEQQLTKASNSNPWDMLASRTGCRGCGANKIAANAAILNTTSLAKFRRQHHAFFARARELLPLQQSPLLHVYSENLTSSATVCNHTMERVFGFLGLPALQENCETHKLKLDWSCNIREDATCSLDKFLTQTQ